MATMQSLSSLRGLGWELSRSNPCDPSPAWCDYNPFGIFFEDCQPIDPYACSGQLGPAATPATVAANQQAMDQGITAYCRTNPEMCAAYEDYQQSQKGWYEYGPYIIGGFGLLMLVLLVRR